MSLDFNQYRGLVAQRVEKMTGRQLDIQGNLDLDISLNPRLVLSDVSLANADWGSQPEMLRVSRLEAAVDLVPLLSGEARITHIRVSGLNLLLETDAQGAGNWVIKKAASQTAESKKSTETPFVPVLSEILLEDLTVVYRDGKNGETYQGQIDNLTARQARRGIPIELDGNGTIAGAAYRVSGTVGPIIDAIEGKDYPVAIDAAAFETDIAIEGILIGRQGGGGLEFGVSAKTADLGKTAEAASAVFPQFNIPNLPAVPGGVSANLRQNENRIEASGIAIKIGDTDLAGNVAVDLSQTRPNLNIALTSNRVDLASIWPEAGAEKAGEMPPKAVRLFPDDPLPLDGLRSVDAKLGLTFASVLLPNGIPIEDIALNARLERGRLTLAPVGAQIGGGSIDGTVEIDGLGNQAGLKVAFTGRNLGSDILLDQLGYDGILEGGAADFNIDLTGNGVSVRDIMAGLDGGLTLEMGEGRVRNAALDIAGADVFMQMFSALNPVATQEDFSALSCAVVNFKVEDGMAKAEKGIALETDKVNVVGEGVIDLKTEKVDFAMKPEARQGAGINLAGGVAGLVRVGGTLAEPGVGVDKVGAAKKAASVGAALATGGLSLLGEALLSRSSRDPSPCLTALGKAPEAKPAAKPAATPKSQPETDKPASAGDKLGEDAKGLFEGVGNALGNIFGGKK
ncbi:MAG: AsmA family protein [Rhodospirillales bacterium]|nr:AsmA family protein [Rhodospirillales bacterium]